MDLRLFHSSESADYRIMDRFNSWTGYIPCHFLEWQGWYYSSIAIRLLGHYRLYQLYKKNFHPKSRDILSPVGYILQRKTKFGLKYDTGKYPESKMEIYVINRMLLYECAYILHEFLANADEDFEKAFNKAIQQIHDPEFLNPASAVTTKPPQIIVQAKAPLLGKGKGVFTKKQILILFDLISKSTKMKSIELDKPNKFDAYAEFLRAVTGKSIDTWLEELKDYRNRDLYHFDTDGERSQLIATLTNLAEMLRKAGLRPLTKLADEKMRELEMNNRSLS